MNRPEDSYRSSRIRPSLQTDFRNASPRLRSAPAPAILECSKGDGSTRLLNVCAKSVDYTL